jgi:hypothetical protein
MMHTIFKLQSVVGQLVCYQHQLELQAATEVLKAAAQAGAPTTAAVMTAAATVARP